MVLTFVSIPKEIIYIFSTNVQIQFPRHILYWLPSVNALMCLAMHQYTSSAFTDWMQKYLGSGYII